MGVPDWLERTELLIGEESIHKLKNAQILLVGLGGVGSYAGEFLVRAGIGSLIIIDGDRVDPTNINRQMQALHSTIGLSKAELLRQRFLDINPGLQIEIHTSFMEPADMELLLQQVEIDFVLDCIDSVLPKLTLIKAAVRAKVKVISAMGAGGKFDPSKVKVADISNTRECKFAQTVRKRLKYLGIRKGILAVYSEEIQPKSALQYTDGSAYKRSFYGTISYMPALFGLRMAAEAISRIIKA
ncbi:MAG TPA: tRNA threonylcarbamoyladenosine dehydratase [Saprospiraceae bacterium]|nr:tRNA threonylcarbamoyladenosine dehydratase [Saprospiraceae bacterium]HRP84469.1 tRNA threonylcarbamoyladenosine dehydratase [Saprospiraceae bacterium]